MLKLSLRQLKYFSVTAETGNIAEAARIVHVAQPSVSSAILKLEGSLNLELFVRHHAKGVSLTPAGHRLLPEANNLLQLAEELESIARVQANELSGPLSVGCYSTLAASYMPPIIAEYAKLHPKVEILIEEDTVDDMMEKLLKGKNEIALAYDIDLPNDLRKLRIHRARPHILLPDGHPLANRSAISLAELKDEPFILLNSKPAENYFLSIFVAVGITPNIAHRSQSFEVVRSLVGQGRGYSVLVTRPKSELTYDGLRVRAVPLSDDVPEQNMCTVRAPGSRATRRSKEFQRICKQLFENWNDPLKFGP